MSGSNGTEPVASHIELPLPSYIHHEHDILPGWCVLKKDPKTWKTLLIQNNETYDKDDNDNNAALDFDKKQQAFLLQRSHKILMNNMLQYKINGATMLNNGLGLAMHREDDMYIDMMDNNENVDNQSYDVYDDDDDDSHIGGEYEG
jgi:hypothetical protein